MANNKYNSNSIYLYQIIFHVLIGFAMFYVDVFPRVYFFLMVGFFIWKIVSVPQNEKTNAILKSCAYIVGIEVLMRMTNGAIFYEASKYLVILFISMGIVYRGFEIKAYPYFIYLVLLIPSIIVASTTIGFDSNFRTNVAFVLSGPVCLGISAIYFYNKKIEFNRFLDLFSYLIMPIVSLTTYLFLYSPSIRDVLKGTESNFAASGGFGPNQVATVLGLGMFALAVRLFIASPNWVIKGVNIVLLGLIGFRAVVTFSRGGVLTAILIICLFLIALYRTVSKQHKSKITLTLASFAVLAMAVWYVSSNQTEGLIDKRYSNQDKLGREKGDLSTGRVDLFVNDLEGFIDNPFFGVGANGAKELRKKANNTEKASHSEISRLLSEHGIFAIVILIILIFVPLVFRLQNKRNIFFYAFLAFWFATINHSAMRIAAPAFIYALTVLNITHEKRSLPRKRLIQER